MNNKISLIIPVKNEASSIGKLLDSVFLQSRIPDEIVITDAGSNDTTRDIVEARKAGPVTIRLIKAGSAYPGTARNIAIKNATSPLIAMTDAGMCLDSIWLEDLERKFTEYPDTDVVYGVFEPVTDTFLKECVAVNIFPGLKNVDGEFMRSASVASCMMKRSVWEAVGGFPDLRTAEDKIFMDRIKGRGFKIRYSSRARIFCDVDDDVIRLFKKLSFYSMHGLIGGRFNDWHRSVVVVYIFSIVMVLAGLIFSPIFFIAIPALMLVRAFKMAVQKMPDKSLWYILNPVRVVLTASIMILSDIALLWGIVRYWVSRAVRQKELI